MHRSTRWMSQCLPVSSRYHIPETKLLLQRIILWVNSWRSSITCTRSVCYASNPPRYTSVREVESDAQARNCRTILVRWQSSKNVIAQFFSWKCLFGSNLQLSDSIVFEDGKSTFPRDLIAHLLLQNGEQIDGQVLDDILRKRLTIQDILKAGLKFLSARASLIKITDTVLIPSDTSATQSHISNRNPTLIPNSVCEGFGIHCHSTLQVKIQFVPLPHRLREEANAAILGIPSAFLDSGGCKLDTLLGFSLKYKQEIATMSPFYQPMLDKQTAEEICKWDFMDIKPDLSRAAS